MNKKQFILILVSIVILSIGSVVVYGDDSIPYPSITDFACTPNPFSAETETAFFTYTLNDVYDEEVEINIYSGNTLLRTLDAGVQSTGPQSVYWDGKDSSGVTLQDGNYLAKIGLDAEGSDRYTLELTWGEYGSGGGQFDKPKGVAVDANGYVYVVDTNNNQIQKFDFNGNFIKMWGSYGTADGQFRNPFSAIIDSNGYLYVTDTDNHRIQKFSLNGDFLGKFGSFGGGVGQMNRPMDIAVDNDDNLYVAEMYGNRVQKFDSAGNSLLIFSTREAGVTTYEMPCGITVDSQGTIYVSYANAYRVQLFDATGNMIDSWQDGYYQARAMAIDSSDNIYVVNSGRHEIIKYDNLGNRITSWGGFTHPHDAAVSSDGSVYVADTYNHRVRKFDTNGAHILTWGVYGSGGGQFNRPKGVAVDDNGYVYVVDTSNNQIQKFDSNGNFIKKWGSYGTADGQFRNPFSAIVDSNGDLYVTDTDNHRIQKFSPNGAFLGKFGSFGGGAGQMNRPMDIAIDSDDNLYVAEMYGNRVQKFDSAGNSILIFSTREAGVTTYEMPCGITVDSQGTIYVSYANAYRVQLFDTTGSMINSWVDNFYQARAMAVDEHDYIYVVNSGRHQIIKYDTAGNIQNLWGGFTHPHDAAVDSDGKIYQADTYNHRIMKFKPILLSVATVMVENVIPDDEPPTVTIETPLCGVYSTATLPPLTYVVSDNIDPNPVVSVTGWVVDEGVHAVTVTVVDETGNAGSDSVIYTVDNTAPVVTILKPNTGIYTSENLPAPEYSVADNLDSNPVVSISGWSEAEGEHTVTVTAVDKAGNSASEIVTYTVDDTAPEVVIDSPLTGVYNVPQTLHYTVSDNVDPEPQVSGPATGTVYDVDGVYLVTVSATDMVGNKGSNSVEFTIDQDSPSTSISLEGTDGENGWYVSDVHVCLDSIDPAPGTGVAEVLYLLNGVETRIQDSSASFTVSSEGVNSLEVWSVDNAGNEELSSSVSIMVDKTAPVISIDSPVDGAVYLLNEQVLAEYSWFDSVSGVSYCIGDVSIGDSIDTGSLGVKSFTVTATDVAGNSATMTVQYDLQYVFSGFTSPVTKGKAAKAGSAIPVKFQLTDATGEYVTDSYAQIWVNGEPGTCRGKSTDGNEFRYDGDSDQYLYNLNTKGLKVGAHTISVTLDDGSYYSIQLSLR